MLSLRRIAANRAGALRRLDRTGSVEPARAAPAPRPDPSECHLTALHPAQPSAPTIVVRGQRGAAKRTARAVRIASAGRALVNASADRIQRRETLRGAVNDSIIDNANAINNALALDGWIMQQWLSLDTTATVVFNVYDVADGVCTVRIPRALYRRALAIARNLRAAHVPRMPLIGQSQWRVTDTAVGLACSVPRQRTLERDAGTGALGIMARHRAIVESQTS